jgi:hypothetical protein
MIAKCGRVKVWHWAHKGRLLCDPWWENETEWHRAWKNRFPLDWQEISQFDQLTGERHIADIKTPHGLVVELQNSPMSLEEMASRERFYGEMIWIINGQRNELDQSYFMMGLSREPIQKNPLAFAFEWWSRGRLFENWSKARAKVFIDFGDEGVQGPPVIWRLAYYDHKRKRGAVGPYPKQLLIDAITKGTEIGVTYLPEEGEV